MKAIDTERTVRVDVDAVVQRQTDACESLRDQLRRAIAREDHFRKVLSDEREITTKLRGIVAAKDRQIDQYEAICNDLMDQLGRNR